MSEQIFVIGAITEQMQAALETKFALHFETEIADSNAWLAAHGDSISYIITNGHDGVKDDYLSQMPNVKIISNYGVGYDAINVTEAAKRGIIVTHTPGVLNEEVATTALLLMLACYRELAFQEAHVRSGRWQTDGNAPLTRSADNRTIGIVGLGRIGEAVARKCAPFNAEILYHNRSEKDVPYRYMADLVAMAEACDVIICTTPGGAGTAKIINQQVLEALGPDGILINVARGSVVDEEALITALSSGKLGWAGLDVFEKEPAVPQTLRDLPNTVLMPHVGSATHETRAAMGALTVDNVLSYHQDGTVISPVPECAAIARLKS